MTSFLSRIAIDATSALTDAYSHVMHGDDAGSSAKVVWVVHPTRVPSEVGMGSDGVGRFTHKFGEFILFYCDIDVNIFDDKLYRHVFHEQSGYHLYL